MARPIIRYEHDDSSFVSLHFGRHLICMWSQRGGGFGTTEYITCSRAILARLINRHELPNDQEWAQLRVYILAFLEQDCLIHPGNRDLYPNGDINLFDLE